MPNSSREPSLRGYDFGGMTTLAVRDGKEVRKLTKEFMTSPINGALQRRQVVFPAEDLEIEDQFTSRTYTLQDGRVVYAKANDHTIDAVRCAMLVPEQANLYQVGEETVTLMPVMTSPVFVRSDLACYSGRYQTYCCHLQLSGDNLSGAEPCKNDLKRSSAATAASCA